MGFMLNVSFTEDESDLLKEVFNLAMGQAGAGLAELLKSFVDLSVPGIRIIEAEDVVKTVLEESVFSPADSVTALRQSFFLDQYVDGEAIVIFNEETIQTISRVFGIDNIAGHTQEIEIMLEMSNIMAGACLNGISNQLFKKDMSFKPPAILAEKIDLQKFVYSAFQRSQLKWDYTLMVKITFNLKDRTFKSDLLIFMSEQTIEAVQKALQKLLSEM
jgi:chemotaxis protein CheC